MALLTPIEIEEDAEALALRSHIGKTFDSYPESTKAIFRAHAIALNAALGDRLRPKSVKPAPGKLPTAK